ncbi:MAG: hypothetical protein ACXITV_09915 [Luteibaculaceae bacterium]
MKNILIFFGLILSTVSCKKDDREFIHYGYIYNENTNQPFANTTFKMYWHAVKIERRKTHLFETDSTGFFRISLNTNGGQLCWPSYFLGAAYLGPEPFRGGDNFQLYYDDKNNEIKNWDIIRTTPHY